VSSGTLLAALFAGLFALLWAFYHLVLPAAWTVAQRAFSAGTRLFLRHQRVARWYERGVARLQPLHPYRSLVLVVAAGFVVSALTGAVFVDLAERVRQQSAAIQALDHRAWEAARVRRSPAATSFFLFWTWLGTPVGIALVLLPVAAVLLARGRRVLALFLVVTPLGGWELNHLLKVFFARARPDLALAVRRASGYSFPSGHAMMSVIAFGALAYAIMRVNTDRRWHSIALALASCVAAAISLSRVYLGVHWLSDIAAGMAAGLVWLATTVGAYEVLRRLRAIRGARPDA
jgi:membrane-associated phospholipid phosphatase